MQHGEQWAWMIVVLAAMLGGGVTWAADVPCWNPSFDVTPADLVTGWVTERGLWTPGAT